MVYLFKRILSRKPQLVILVSLALFLFYFTIIHNRQKILDLDFTRKSYKKIKNMIDVCNPITKRNCGNIKFKETNEVRWYVETTLEEALKEDKGTGCDIPKLNPFAKEIMKFMKEKEFVQCPGRDWVRCYLSTCRVIPEVLAAARGVKCAYRDIVYDTDYKRHLGSVVELQGDAVYVLAHSDHVKITCIATSVDNTKFPFDGRVWSGHGTGFRTSVKPKTPPKGREDTINVLIFGFDSTSRNGFIRKMPKSYKVLTEELNFTVLNGYNIVGDATIAALIPLLTGRTELELPEVRKSIKKSGYVDQFPLVFYKFRNDGYRTAYFEDMPGIGTFQYRFRGFLKQPTDHYLRQFYLEEDSEKKKPGAKKHKFSAYCIGDTPRHELMMNITDQFLTLDGKKFIFTFIADITHNDFNMISTADAVTVRFLRALKDRDQLRDTLIMVMGDHGPRYTHLRKTFQGKLEERLPLMAIRLPEVLKRKRPRIQAALEKNADALTTPHDIYATVLDAIDMRVHWNPHKIRGADLTRGLTLLEPIPSNRSCSEAGIEPHWCTCLKWENLHKSDPLYEKAANALVEQINNITESMRHVCAVRTLLEVQWVMKKKANKAMIEFQGARDNDGYVGKFGGSTTIDKLYLQTRIAVSPGRGDYEGSMNYIVKEDKFIVNYREISRTNAYNNEPSCISETHPHLNMYCYCKKQT